MTPAELERALCRAAAVALLGERVSTAERQQAAQTLALLDLVQDVGHRRVTTMRIIPARSTGKPHQWSHIAASMRITRVTARKWHAASLAVMAAAIDVEDGT